MLKLRLFVTFLFSSIILLNFLSNGSKDEKIIRNFISNNYSKFDHVNQYQKLESYNLLNWEISLNYNIYGIEVNFFLKYL